jgi:protein-S-isoprenylcysteine O-methyltransferase Ste14
MSQSALSRKARTMLLLRALLTPALMFGLLFLVAGRWDYWQAWVYIVLNMIIMLLMWTLLSPSRELIEERLNPKGGTKIWDILYFAITTPLYVLALILGGLDARYGWSRDMPMVIYWTGVAVYVIGQAIFLWARRTNKYFSSVVRIQTDRGQSVCMEGPYRYVRHPGYVGGFLFEITTGIMLGSWWASIPQVIAALMLLWRTAWEDKTLLAELSGYTEYSKETRYRLLPGVW